ncbi:MAG: hypothetical protein HUU21_33285, partial [Polyangiaceae bacterium]|nr:hypothetical protein [Polyangiaceae bacterium]
MQTRGSWGFWVLFTGAAVSIAWGGCGDDEASTSGAQTSSSSGGDPTSSSSGGDPTSSSSSGGPIILPDCKTVLVKELNLFEACETCLYESCCYEVSVCGDRSPCPACVTGEEECTDEALEASTALTQCAQADCKQECFDPPGPPVELDCTAPISSPSGGSCVTLGDEVLCNPVTNAPCDGSIGESCDFGAAGLECYPPPNPQGLCAACGPNILYCSGGLTCVGGKCAKFCCDDGDCSASAKCDVNVLDTGTFGICVQGSGGAGGMGGAG